MAVSGVIGQTFTTQQVIDHAFRACGLAPQEIAGEDLNTAIEQLNFMLSRWATDGTPLWCQTKYTLPLTQGLYQLPVASFFPGVVDIIEANLQQCTRFTGLYTSTSGNAALAFDFNPQTACTQTAPGGSITMQLTSPMAVTNIGIMSVNGGAIDFELQYSLDGISYATFYDTASNNVKFTSGVFTWLDNSSFGVLPTAAYWRLQAGVNVTLNIAELFFGNNPMEIPVSRINKDDYWNLPNKTFQGRPVQYWCDRQLTGPVMWLWPSPGFFFQFQQLTVLAHRQIMNTTDLQGNIEIPQRGFDAVWASLGERLRMLIPKVDKKNTMDLPGFAQQCRMAFWGEERDEAPIFLQVDISAYTK